MSLDQKNLQKVIFPGVMVRDNAATKYQMYIKNLGCKMHIDIRGKKCGVGTKENFKNPEMI